MRLKLLIVFQLLCLSVLHAQTLPQDSISIKTVQDSAYSQVQTDSPQVSALDSAFFLADTIPSSPKKSDIETTVFYKARDSIRTDFLKQEALLFGDAEINFGEMTITADFILINWLTNEVVALGTEDSTGKLKGTPVFKQGSDQYVAREIRYNYKTEKGLINGIVTQQGEGYIQGERVKKNEKDEMFIREAIYTTCNLAHPHFCIRAGKIKMIKDDKIVTGPFSLEIEDIPTPLGFIFGMFPVTNRDKSSGIIVPTYGEALDRGFFLRNGGYYWAINDYMELRALGEIYSKGGFGITPVFNYRKRYAYDGGINFQFRKVPIGDPIDSSTFQRDLWFDWRHNPVQRGNSRFSASVSLGSSSFNRNNAFATQNVLAGNFNSTVSYFTTFPGTPFNLTVSARQSQNTQTNVMTATLPDVNFSMNRIYPFKGKISKNRWYETVNLGYQGTFQNNLTNAARRNPYPFMVSNALPPDSLPIPITVDSLPTILSRAQNGVLHTIPITATARIFKYFNLNPSFTYTEFWWSRKLNYGGFNPADSTLRIDTIAAPTRAHQYTFATDLTTKIYGTFNFRGKRLKAVRHLIIPTVGFVYNPDFTDPSRGHYQERQVSADGRTQNLSVYQGFLNGGPSLARSQSIRFSLQNSLEAKVADGKSDSATTKKIPLLSSFNISGSYNFAADSNRLTPLAISAATIIGQKLNISFSSTLNPYAVRLDSTQIVGDRQLVYQTRSQSIYAWQAGQGIGQITSYSLNMNTNLNPDAIPAIRKREPKNEQEEAVMRQIMNNPDQYVDFSLPWSLNMSYNLVYFKDGFREKSLTQTLNFSGDIKLTEKWKVGASSGFDLVTEEFTYTSIDIFRDLHCWQMRLNWVPFGFRQSFSFDIHVKASVLQDLKMSKRRSWYDR